VRAVLRRVLPMPRLLPSTVAAVTVAISAWAGMRLTLGAARAQVVGLPWARSSTRVVRILIAPALLRVPSTLRWCTRLLPPVTHDGAFRLLWSGLPDPSSVVQRSPLRRHGLPVSTPAMALNRPPKRLARILGFGPRLPRRRSCSTFAVSRCLGGLLHRLPCGFVAPRCRPWGSPGFWSSSCASPRDPIAFLSGAAPFEAFPSSPAAMRLRTPCPPAVHPPRGARLQGLEPAPSPLPARRVSASSGPDASMGFCSKAVVLPLVETRPRLLDPERPRAFSSHPSSRGHSGAICLLCRWSGALQLASLSVQARSASLALALRPTRAAETAPDGLSLRWTRAAAVAARGRDLFQQRLGSRVARHLAVVGGTRSLGAVSLREVVLFPWPVAGRGDLSPVAVPLARALAQAAGKRPRSTPKRGSIRVILRRGAPWRFNKLLSSCVAPTVISPRWLSPSWALGFATALAGGGSLPSARPRAEAPGQALTEVA